MHRQIRGFVRGLHTLRSQPASQAVIGFITEAKYELMPGVHHSEDGDDCNDGSELRHLLVISY